jgi:hypothetical protein
MFGILIDVLIYDIKGRLDIFYFYINPVVLNYRFKTIIYLFIIFYLL